MIHCENIVYRHRHDFVEKMLDTSTIHAIERINFSITENDRHIALHRVAGTAH